MGSVIAAVASLLVAGKFRKDRRASVLTDLQIYNALPESSEQRRAVLQRIDESLGRIEVDHYMRRDWWSLVLAIIALLSGIAVVIGQLSNQDTAPFWYLPVGAAIVGVSIAAIGFAFPKHYRDPR